MSKVWLIGLGAFVGANARYWMGHWIQQKAGYGFPYGTLAVNVLGSLAIGVLAAVAARLGLSDNWRLLLIVGLLGGFTTFSSFSLEVLTLLRKGHFAPAAGYIAATNTVCLLACWGGFALAERMRP